MYYGKDYNILYIKLIIFIQELLQWIHLKQKLQWSL